MQTKQTVKTNSDTQASNPKPVSSAQNASLDVNLLPRFLGNQVQTKLAIGSANDVYEQEADRVAEQVTSMRTYDAAVTPISISNVSPVQRKCSACRPLNDRDEDELTVQTKAKPSHAVQPSSNLASKNFYSYINSTQDRGQALSEPVRGFYEPRFAYDFSQVRIHSDARSANASESIGAKAFTVGNNIYFGAGQYAPDTLSGQKLLAHELTHTIQQSSLPNQSVQRVCDPAILSARTVPVFFGQDPAIMAVFTGASSIVHGSGDTAAIGLIQQALVDLGYSLGTSGPNGDGVDGFYEGLTEAAVTAFQTAESVAGATAGEMDQSTLQCLDETRSHLIVPPHLTGSVSPDQYRIDGVSTRSRDEDIYFARGSSTLNATGQSKITTLMTRAASIQGCAVTLEGFISEDERVEFGAGLAQDRINAVEAELASQNHDDPGSVCTAPAPPLRIHSPLPDASAGVSGYRNRRKVEIVPAGSTSTTSPCPAAAPQHRSLNAAENTTLTDAIDLAFDWMDDAIAKLTPGHAEGDPALTEYFGGTGRRSTIKSNMETWRDHLNTTVRSNNQFGTECNPTCRTAIAFNSGSGASAMMTLCPVYYRSLSMHPTLNQDQKKAFVVMHEAGHGSIRTRDSAYGHRRLIEFLDDYSAIAETNTDSYTLMTLCLNGLGFCAAPAGGASDTTVGLSAAQHEKARRGLAWLETWLTWAQQDTTGVYKYMNLARQNGHGLTAERAYYGGVFDPPMINAFNFRRPAGDPPPTFREQTTVAAILDRITFMKNTVVGRLTIENDTSATPSTRWVAGSPAPASSLFLDAVYFALSSDRGRVDKLLPEVIEATGSIDAAQRSSYEDYIEELVRVKHGDRPT